MTSELLGKVYREIFIHDIYQLYPAKLYFSPLAVDTELKQFRSAEKLIQCSVVLCRDTRRCNINSQQ